MCFPKLGSLSFKFLELVLLCMLFLGQESAGDDISWTKFSSKETRNFLDCIFLTYLHSFETFLTYWLYRIKNLNMNLPCSDGFYLFYPSKIAPDRLLNIYIQMGLP